MPDAFADPKISIATQNELKKGPASSGDVLDEGAGMRVGTCPDIKWELNWWLE